MIYTEQSSENTMTINQEDHHDNNYNKAHAPGRFLTPEDCECIKAAYATNIGNSMTAAVAHMIEQAFENGLTADQIVMAINETGFAPRPSPAYLRAILKNWTEHGVTLYRAKSNMDRPEPWWKQSTFNYQQHNYSETDFNSNFFYDPAKDYAQ